MKNLKDAHDLSVIIGQVINLRLYLLVLKLLNNKPNLLDFKIMVEHLHIPHQKAF
jgi:hypothetical protein